MGMASRAAAVALSLSAVMGCASEKVVAPPHETSTQPLLRTVSLTQGLGVSVFSDSVSRFKSSGFVPFSAQVSQGGVAPYKYDWYVSYCYLDGTCWGKDLLRNDESAHLADTIRVEVTSDMSWIRVMAIVSDSHTITYTGISDKEIINFYGGGSGTLTHCYDAPGDDADIGFPDFVTPPDSPEQDGWYRVDECNNMESHCHVPPPSPSDSAGFPKDSSEICFTPG
jgi:hypothetical protein